MSDEWTPQSGYRTPFGLLAIGERREVKGKSYETNYIDNSGE